MARFLPTIITVLAVAAGASAAENGDVENPVMPSFTLKGLFLGRRVQFGDSLKDCQSRTDFNVSLSLDPGELIVREVVSLTLEEATTSSGEKLTLTERDRRSMDRKLQALTDQLRDDRSGGNRSSSRRPRPGQPPRPGRADPGVRVMLDLAPPVRALQGLERLKGRLVVRHATGPRQQVVLDPLEEWLDKSVQIKGQKTCFITLTRQGDSIFKLGFSKDFAPLFEELRAYDAEGGRIEAKCLELSRKAGAAAATYGCKLPEGGHLTVVFRKQADQIKERVVVFDFADIPLPGPDFLPTPDAVAKPEAVDVDDE